MYLPMRRKKIIERTLCDSGVWVLLKPKNRAERLRKIPGKHRFNTKYQVPESHSWMNLKFVMV
jgi:hypothetical protein